MFYPDRVAGDESVNNSRGRVHFTLSAFENGIQ